MGDIKTPRDAKRFRSISTRPAVTTSDIVNNRVPPRTIRNLHHGHTISGARDIRRIGRVPGEKKTAEDSRLLEGQRYDKANRYYSALERIQILLTDARRREENLRVLSEELQTSSEELQASNEEMQATMSEMEKSNAYRQSLMDTMRDILMTMDTSGVIAEVNLATMRISGYGREELIGQPFSKFFTDTERAQSGIREVLEKGEVANYGLTVITKDGRQVPVSYNATVLREPGGDITGILGSARDTTKVDKLIDDLRSTMAEFEAFSYSVSHDLRAPLRSIDGFSHALLDDYAGKLDAQGKDYLQHVCDGVKNMGKLIDAMLNLARISRAEMKPEKIDLSEMALRIAAELQKTDPKRQVEFIIEKGLVANGDARLLQVVLENLFANAWKFTGKKPVIRIELGALLQKDGKLAFFVRDNGAGFDMTYADKLFGVFQRLHSPTDFPGIGIGLATAQRIVRRHGGRIWAEGAVEQGATFYFTL